MDIEQKRALVDLEGLRDQIEKEHWLNVHFRAFQLANEAWQHHIRANAIHGSRDHHSPGGAVLDGERDGR